MFYPLAAVTVVSALAVITARNPVRSAMALVATLAALAVCFVALGAHLVAALQIIVYAGAVMVLFLFVIMLLNVQEDPHEGGRTGLKVAAAAIGAALAALFGTVLLRGGGSVEGAWPAGFGTTRALARVLFGDYLVAFELTSVLLLVAVVGAVVLARHDSDESDPGEVEEPQ